jgi:hypothetical protein
MQGLKASTLRPPMSALGQRQTCALQNAMSALPPIETTKAKFRKSPCPLYHQNTESSPASSHIYSRVNSNEIVNEQSAMKVITALTACAISHCQRSSCQLAGIAVPVASCLIGGIHKREKDRQCCEQAQQTDQCKNKRRALALVLPAPRSQARPRSAQRRKAPTMN